MRIRFLGTAAYEGIPALFCPCDICKNAREKGGRENSTGWPPAVRPEATTAGEDSFCSRC